MRFDLYNAVIGLKPDTGDYYVKFKHCSHTDIVTRQELSLFRNQKEILQYFSSLKCSDCFTEFKKMERLLHQQYEMCIRNGGLK